MQNNTAASYMTATGVIQYNMTNDYMFRYILQNNKEVLKGLTGSLLHLQPEEIQKIEITNPIEQSESIAGKEFVLDINITLNDNTVINLEMQVMNQHNWLDRSLAYLCRTFDGLYRGQEYDEALPVTHIGFLDFTLFPDEPEFYATNMLMNIKTHKIFNDKFRLSVVDLTKIEMATDEDTSWNLDYWARLFKAKTWEEIKMLAEKNEYLQEAAQSIYMANAEEMVRQKCRAREDAERHERTLKRDMKKLEAEKKTLQEDISSLQEAKTVLQKDNSALQKDLAEKEAYIAELESRLKLLQ